jgi:hypothetical protein
MWLQKIEQEKGEHTMRSVRMSHSLAVRATLALLALIASLAVIPTATAQDDGPSILIRLRTVLHGPVLNGEKPSGKAEFEQENSRRKFSAEVDNVKVANGTVLVVKVNGQRVGKITVQLEGGALLLTGKRAPSVTKGTRVGIFLGTQRILTGVF